jgi:hypothetical protein
MAYSDFTIDRVREELGITFDFSHSLFSDIPSVAASDWLVETLALMAPLATANTEKARSEFMIAPILSEIARKTDYSIFVFSGKDFNVSSDRGLVGYCDFLLSRSPEAISIQAPVCAIVEAKKEDINSGIAQCVAEMVAAQIFNDAKGTPLKRIYGVVTSGMAWRFLVLENNVAAIDRVDYYVSQVDKILGILLNAVQE